jgi:hypothetical protein
VFAAGGYDNRLVAGDFRHFGAIGGRRIVVCRETGCPFLRADLPDGSPVMKILIIVVVVVALLIVLAFSVRIIKQYERGVLFRLGRLRGSRAPGLRLIIPFVDVLHRVSLRIITMRSSRRASSPGTT